MAAYRLIIGDKNLSSWSLRAWLLLRQFALPFEEILIHLDRPGTQRRILEHSPAGRVPVLTAGDETIWDSLAITEFIAERHPELAIWPRPDAQRARARVVTAEMHAGFAALREDLSFTVQAPAQRAVPGPDAQVDIARICQIWRHQRQQGDIKGDFLFGPFCAADAAFAPVAVRFHVHGVTLDELCQDYVHAVLGLSAMTDWLAAARREIVPPSG